MKTELKTLAGFLAAAMCADGVCDLREEKMLQQIAESHKLPFEELQTLVREWVSTYETLTSSGLFQRLSLLGMEVMEDDKSIIFDCVLEIIMADSTLTHAEVETALNVAISLGVSLADAVLQLAQFVSLDKNMSVEY